MVESVLSQETQESIDMKLKSWSYTRLNVFESCKQHAKFSYIDKIPEPERPLPPGKTEHANDRGSRIHDAAEKFVKGGVELIPELQKFKPEFLKAREMYAESLATTEGDWAFTRQWEPVAWMSSDVWVRIKLDLCVRPKLDTAIVVDYKTGKKWGNEVKHNEQMQLYVIGTLCRYPKVKFVTTELWYTDLDEISSVTYTRDQGLRFVPNYERRGDLLTMCEDFPPNPNVYSCRWCPFKAKDKGGSGDCLVSV